MLGAYMKEQNVDRSVKRKLSPAELAAIEDVLNTGSVPSNYRKRKRILRIARQRVRRQEINRSQKTGFREPTEEALKAAVEFFSKWQKPEMFIAELERLARHVPAAKRFGRRYKFLREAIVLAEFCRQREVLAVRISEKDPPDSWIRINPDEDLPVEVTEVQEAGRKRGDEIKKLGVLLGTYVPNSREAEHTEAIVGALEKAVEAKAQKYTFKPRLLVYLNIPHRETAEKAIQNSINALREKFSDRLSAIDVITDRKLLS